MRRFCKSIFLMSVLSVLLGNSFAIAATINNFQSAFRTSGADLNFTYNFSAWDGGAEVLPPTFANAGASFREFGDFGGGGGGTGLGSIVVQITRGGGAAGTATGSFHSYFDLEVLDAPSSNSFFDEFGAAAGPLGGTDPTSWEIDEPGFFFGDIDSNFVNGNLDNTNGVPASAPDDVAAAMGWDISLNAGESASLTLVVSDAGSTAPLSNFFITHTDPLSDTTITYSGALSVTADDPNGNNPIPEPSTMLLLGTGLGGLILWRRRFHAGK